MRVMDGKLNYKQKKILKPMVDAVERTTDMVQSPLAVVVVGAGPIALRTAIELALTGCHMSILERQPPGVIDSRPNMLKLWDWTFQDLKRSSYLSGAKWRVALIEQAGLRIARVTRRARCARARARLRL
jgi:cation diffusion facilitator CzcD-associated flavoprotein CzcO